LLPLLSEFGLRLIYVILFVSSLSFLGLGIQPPRADWGSMVRENIAALQFGASAVPVLAPAMAIASVTMAINFIVDDFTNSAGRRRARGR
jgi:peptide/nickel transport system permease protein